VGCRDAGLMVRRSGRGRPGARGGWDVQRGLDPGRGGVSETPASYPKVTVLNAASGGGDAWGNRRSESPGSWRWSGFFVMIGVTSSWGGPPIRGKAILGPRGRSGKRKPMCPLNPLSRSDPQTVPLDAISIALSCAVSTVTPTKVGLTGGLT